MLVGMLPEMEAHFAWATESLGRMEADSQRGGKEDNLVAEGA